MTAQTPDAPGAPHTATFPVFAPHSSFASSINSLSHGVLWAMLGILLIVVSIVTYSTWRFRERPGGPPPKLIFGNIKLEVAYTCGFVVILGVISYFSLVSMHASDPPVALGRGQDNILVIGHQWWWEVRYPGTGIRTANEIHLPVAEPQRLGLRSADVIHDFWVPELGRKMDVIPGVENQTWIAAGEPGVYYGRCAEFCGQEHAWMRLRVVAQSPAEFAKWEQAQLLTPRTPADGAPGRGAAYFQQLSCAACHTIRGTPAHGDVGPDLTHVGGRDTLVAGRLANTPANLAVWLLEPDLVKPGAHMPNLHLTREQQDTLVAYLEGLR